jgi:hypothetical protein
VVSRVARFFGHTAAASGVFYPTRRGRVQQLGDLGDSGGARVDVAHRGARRSVPGLGHDQLQRDLFLAEVRRGGVAQLVQSPA